MEGKIITFYSYKGGVGRSMALANIAILMKRWGYKVLILDWDLEAPGIENFFKDYISVSEFQKKEGIVDILLSHTQGNTVEWKKTVQNVPIETNNNGIIDLITSGIRDDNYFKNVRKFDFDDFYTNHDGGEYIEALRNQWKTEYDFVLVDSRTGVTDIGGVCTVQLPEIVVLLFTATEQSLQGILKVGKKINESLANLPVERYNLPLLPIPSRFDNVTEYKIGQEWLERLSIELLPLVESWLLEDYQSPIRFKTILELIKVPYIPYFSFGEKLPVVEQGTNDSTGIGYVYETISSILVNNLFKIESLFNKREKIITQSYKFHKEEYYDVFICYDSNVRQYAEKLSLYLSNNGFKVFNNEKKQQQEINIEYSSLVDFALENTKNLIVIGSTIEALKAPSIQFTWQSFINQNHENQELPNLVTILTQKIGFEELPLSLRQFPIFEFSIPNMELILHYMINFNDFNKITNLWWDHEMEFSFNDEEEKKKYFIKYFFSFRAKGIDSNNWLEGVQYHRQLGKNVNLEDNITKTVNSLVEKEMNKMDIKTICLPNVSVDRYVKEQVYNAINHFTTTNGIKIIISRLNWDLASFKVERYLI